MRLIGPMLLIFILLAVTINLVDKCNSSKSKRELICTGSFKNRGPVGGGTEIFFLCDKETPPGSYITIGGKKLEKSSVDVTETLYSISGVTPAGNEGVAPIELRNAKGEAIKVFGLDPFTYTNETNASLILKVKKMLSPSRLDNEKAKEYLNQISKDSPEWKNEGERLSMLVDKRIVMDEKRQKKSEGVSIGMTKQDVLDSVWGRPRSINKTHTVYGIHEQWCYDGNNYLYFENGILTSIQN